MAARWVIVDDSDPGIQYEGPWVKGPGQTDGVGNFGPPFQRTSHGVFGQAGETANLSYAFNGSRVRAFGTCLASDLYTWECFVDNISIGSKPPTNDPKNNWIFCDSDSLVDGPHNFTLQATLYGYDFWVDQIQYVPSAGMSLDSSLILVNASDSAIQYAGWQDMGRIDAWNVSYYKTLQTGLKTNMTFDFNGTSLKWFSLLVNETPSQVVPGSTDSSVGTASYSIDGAEPVPFELEPPTSGPIQYNRLLFQVQNLTAEQHRLSVVHTGDNVTTPLTLNYLIIQNPPALVATVTGGTPTTISSSSSSSSSSSNPGGFNSATSSASNGHKSAPIGAIVGGATGGVIMVILFLLLFRRQSKRKLLGIAEPFNAPPTAPILFRKIFAGGQSSSNPVPGALPGHIPQRPTKLVTSAGPRPPTSGNKLNRLPNQASGSNANHNLTPGNSRPREVDELGQLPSVNLLSVLPETPVASDSYSPSDTLVPQSVLRHEDSGIRLSARESMLELPPLYTLS